MSTHKGYLPVREGDIGNWLQVFGHGLGKYGATLGLTPAEIADGQANCLFGAAVIEVQNEVAGYAKSLTQFKQAALWATGPCTAWPAGYTLPAALPPLSHAGVLALVTLLVKRLKAYPAYTVDIGKELGIEGTAPVVAAAASVAAAKPVLKVRLDTGGHPLVVWKKGDMEGVEIWVDRSAPKGRPCWRLTRYRTIWTPRRCRRLEPVPCGRTRPSTTLEAAKSANGVTTSKLA